MYMIYDYYYNDFYTKVLVFGMCIMQQIAALILWIL